MTKRFYVDACIWLNLFKKEGDPTKGVPYWKIARNFVNKIIFSDDKEIVYTNYILKEIKFNINNERLYEERLKFIKGEPKIKFIKFEEKDFSFARELESRLNYEISFFDCLHIAITKRLNLILVTRDKDLFIAAKKYVSVNKPEELIS